MRLRRGELGFTLIEMIVVTAIVVVVAGALGTFFLAGASPAVASAGRDVTAAFDEARRTASAFDAATVVFAPAQSGTGYSARVYARFPGDPAFQPRNGPAYDSTVTISETASPLGSPGFAFTVDSHGAVTAFASFVAGATAFTTRPCPATGTFTLHLAYERDVRIISIPCQLPLSSVTPVAFETPAPALSPAAAPRQTCPGTETCTLAVLTPPPGGATCPPGYTPDATAPGVCDIAAIPSPAPSQATCPPGYRGEPPTCVVVGVPTPVPSTPPTPSRCVAGIPDALAFATCIESDPITILGSAIAHAGCGTRTPIADPGASITVTVDVWKDGASWGSYAVGMQRIKSDWFDVQAMPPAQTCGLLYALKFNIATIAPESGNAVTTPFQDTGDPALENAGVDAILVAPLGGGWGSNT